MCKLKCLESPHVTLFEYQDFDEYELRINMDWFPPAYANDPLLQIAVRIRPGDCEKGVLVFDSKATNIERIRMPERVGNYITSDLSSGEGRIVTRASTALDYGLIY